MEAMINLTSTGLVFGDITVVWCKEIVTNNAVSETSMTLVERANGFYKLTNPNITEDTDFYVEETATPENFAVGIFSPADGDIARDSTVAKEATVALDSTVAKDATVAKEASLDDIKGTGFDTGQHNLKEIKNTIG